MNTFILSMSWFFAVAMTLHHGSDYQQIMNKISLLSRQWQHLMLYRSDRNHDFYLIFCHLPNFWSYMDGAAWYDCALHLILLLCIQTCSQTVTLKRQLLSIERHNVTMIFPIFLKVYHDWIFYLLIAYTTENFPKLIKFLFTIQQKLTWDSPQ